ncbi:MAG: asparaginase [Solirubrobacterales bacterium]
MAGIKRIGLITTGGTIGSMSEERGSVARRLVKLVGSQGEPVVLGGKKTSRVIYRESLEFVVRQPVNALSEDMTPGDWTLIAREIDDLCRKEEVKGVLVLHGTDTMAYSAMAMTFMLTGVDVPIVFTGANLPPDEAGSDADTNISDALVAFRKLPAGVFISFAGKPDAISWVMESVSARKVRASGPAYRSTNRGPVATVENGRFKFRRSLEEVPRSPSRIEVSDRVIQLSLHPGIDLSAMIDVIELREIRGVVVSTYPAFTAPSYPPSSSLPDFVARCSAMDVAVALTVGNAPVGRTNAYGSTLHMIESDALLLSTMPEVALVKMMWATGCTRDVNEVRTLMLEPIATEFGPKVPE